MFEITGKIKVIFDTQTFASGFAKREFVITTEHDKFPQDLKFEVVKDKCAVLDGYQIGQPVTVNFDVRGNEFNGKYYVNLSCWKIQSNGAPQQGQTRQAPRNQAIPSNRPSRAPETPLADDPEDDCPF